MADLRVVAVSAGAVHNLALTAYGALWSWGGGVFGQLGHGDLEEQLLPKKVEVFAGRRVVLTPTETTTETALAVVRATWEAAGARVECMSPDHHDEVLAATSHLPHVLAYALVDCLAGMEGNRELFAYAAGGFRDFTRIASSSPEMWRDILMENRAALEPTLEAFETTLSAMRVALRSGDEASVLATLQRARTARERFLNLMDAPDAR